MRRFNSHAAILLLATIAAACGTGDSSPTEPNPSAGDLDGAGVQLTTDRASYQAGDPVGLTIVNQEADKVAYNACTRDLEVRDGGQWTPAPASLRPCTREVWYVEAGSSREDSTELDIGLAPGEYRIVLNLTRDYTAPGESIRATTNAFLIDP